MLQGFISKEEERLEGGGGGKLFRAEQEGNSKVKI
jgi:hypothetical protein